MLFTYTSVLNYSASLEGWAWNLSRWSEQQDAGQTKTNRKIAHETEQQEPQFNLEVKPWKKYSRGAARRWLFEYVQNHSWIIMLHSRKELLWIISNMLSMINHDYSVIRDPKLQYCRMFIFAV
jgi:hypothetical protein